MLNSDNFKRELCLASSLRDGLEDNNLKQIKLLLFDKRANPNILIPPHGISPFHLVVGNDSESFAEEVTKLFLCHGGDPNIKSNDGLTPVHVAAAWGRTNILELLLANGGNPLSTDDEGYTPFHYAFDGKYYKAITILGKYCEECSTQDEIPKYKMTLDKILIKNGDMIAEYEISNDSIDNLESSPDKINHDSGIDNLKHYSNDIPIDSLSIDPSSDEIDWNNRHELFSKNQHGKESKNLVNINKTLFDDKLGKKNLLNNITETDRNVGETPSRIPRLKCNDKSRNNKNKTSTKNMKLLDHSILSKSPNCRIPLSNDKKWKSNEIAQSLPKRKSKNCIGRLVDEYEKKNNSFENGTSSSSNESNLITNTPKMNIICDNYLREENNFSFDSLRNNCSLTQDFSKTYDPRGEEDFDESNPIENEIESPLLFSRTSDSEPSLNDKSLRSVTEEYKYEDLEKGIIFLERRLCITPDCRKDNNNRSDDGKLIYSSSIPKELQLIDNATLRRKLTKLGDAPGPITHTTKKVYLKRLINLEKRKRTNPTEIGIDLNNHIETNLMLENWIIDIEIYKNLEQRVFQEFITPDPSRKWREGTSKTCFNYLLLDPRVTLDLPNRRTQLTESELWIIFISAIFYVGKGQRTRPYSHLYDAFNVWVSKNNEKNNKGQCVGVTSNNEKCNKIKRILDIWDDGYGVVCLHLFQNTIPVEAYTREALMIKTLGLEQLVNCKDGQYYGIVATWSIEEKIKLGKYILYKAMQIFIHEGERQLFPEHL